MSWMVGVLKDAHNDGGRKATFRWLDVFNCCWLGVEGSETQDTEA